MKNKSVVTNETSWAYHSIVERLAEMLICNAYNLDEIIEIRSDLSKFIHAWYAVDAWESVKECKKRMKIMQSVQDKYKIEVYFPRAKGLGNSSKKCFETK